MKTIYLIRHGESEGNVGANVQGPDSPLNEKGLAQAKILGERLLHLDFDRLISSTYIRAIQTAEVISKITGKKFGPSEQNALLVERKRPSRQVGMLQGSQETKNIFLEYMAAFENGEKYEDGESFQEITNRASAALDFLNSLPEEKIVVVTHGIFMRIIAAVVFVGKDLTAPVCISFYRKMKTDNTGIMVIEKESDEEGWYLRTWNDRSHFAEN